MRRRCALPRPRGSSKPGKDPQRDGEGGSQHRAKKAPGLEDHLYPAKGALPWPLLDSTSRSRSSTAAPASAVGFHRSAGPAMAEFPSTRISLTACGRMTPSRRLQRRSSSNPAISAGPATSEESGRLDPRGIRRPTNNRAFRKRVGAPRVVDHRECPIARRLAPSSNSMVPFTPAPYPRRGSTSAGRSGSLPQRPTSRGRPGRFQRQRQWSTRF